MEVVSASPIKQSELKRTLSSSSFFSHADEKLLQNLLSVVQVIELPENELLFEKGEKGDSMYIVHSGQVKVHDNDITLNLINPGELFGEMAALDNDVRTASISSTQNTTLVKINKDTILDLINSSPQVATSIICSLCGSMRSRVNEITEDSYHIRELETELKIGRNIQSGFLPDRLPDMDGWKLSDCFHAAKECAGDFYDAFIVEQNNHLAFIIADVADKGVGAALFMTLFRSLLRVSTNTEKYSKLNDLLPDLTKETTADDLLLRSISVTNNYISMTHSQSSMFSTVFFAMVDLDSGQINYINCGHENVFVITDGVIQAELPPTGPVIGLFPDALFKVRQAVLKPGDVLFAYTDGVTEAMNNKGEQFGVKRLEQCLYSSRNSGNTKHIINSVEGCIWEFTKNAVQSDDITMLALERLKP